jgi:hypothetical protein
VTVPHPTSPTAAVQLKVTATVKHFSGLLVGGALFERLQHQLRRPALYLTVQDDEALVVCMMQDAAAIGKK